MPGANSIQDASIDLEVFLDKITLLNSRQLEVKSMKPEYKIKILYLRKDEKTCKEIAIELGLSVDSVTKFLQRHPDYVDENRICPQCGSAFKKSKGHNPKKFCSNECRMKWWNSHRDLIKHKNELDLNCQHCGKVFSSFTPGRKFCSIHCSLAERYGHE